MQRDGHDFHCIVFLRNDVYELLIRSTSDFGKEMRVSLDWNDPELLRDIVRSRLASNEDVAQHLFVRLEDVREAAYWLMLEYNEERPHDSLGDLTPVEFAITARNSGFELSP